MISKNLKEYYNYSGMSEEDIERYLTKKSKLICKPCWELKYCPYGPMIEGLPCPSITKKEALENIEYLKECLARGKMGRDFQYDLDIHRKDIFEIEISKFNIDDYEEGPFNLEKELSCKVFGHICPVYLMYEEFTETESTRKRGRNISFSTKVRLIRRANYTCQVCGKFLKESEIEFDHIIPISKGGSSEENNIRVTCFNCNRRKSNKTDNIKK